MYIRSGGGIRFVSRLIFLKLRERSQILMASLGEMCKKAEGKGEIFRGKEWGKDEDTLHYLCWMIEEVPVSVCSDIKLLFEYRIIGNQT